MELFVLFLAAMTLPGMILSRILGLDVCRVAVATAMSLALLIIFLAAARIAELGADGFGYLLVTGYAGIAGGAVWSWRRGRLTIGGPFRFERIHWIPTATMTGVGLYAVWAGPYLEIPADVWWHIGRINEWLGAIPGGAIGGYASLGSPFDQYAQHWHVLAAYFVHISGVELTQALAQFAVANTLLLSAAVYAFALQVFQEFVPSRSMRHTVAAATVFFFIAQFGLSVFSYVRYYTLAPTMLAYVVYLAGLACFLQFIKEGSGGYRYLGAVVLFVVIAAAAHKKQEAVFIVTMAGLVLLWEYARIAHRWGPAWIVRPAAYQDDGQRRIALLLGVLVIAYVVGHAFAYVLLDRHSPLDHGRMVDVHNYLPFLKNLYVLKPTFQFYQVVTVWGVLVYVLFVFHIRHFLKNSYLIAGMALPFLTVFNPVFTDFFLRFTGPQVLWRMCYALPLPFAGGYFLVRSIDNTVRGNPWRSRAAGLATAAALIGLLLPINTTFFVSPHSKIYTLAPVGPENDRRLWADLVDFLQGRTSEGMITDPVTGYVAGSLSGHRYPGYKFYGQGVFPVDGDNYWAADFANRNGWLVVINRRDGALSATGRYAGHWPEDIMKVSKRYSDAFVSYVADHPSIFMKLWSSDRIAVYLVKAS